MTAPTDAALSPEALDALVAWFYGGPSYSAKDREMDRKAADAIAALREREAHWKEWARSVSYRLNGAQDVVSRAICHEAAIWSDPDDEPSAGDYECTR
jgi:hypothetical protein